MKLATGGSAAGRGRSQSGGDPRQYTGTGAPATFKRAVVVDTWADLGIVAACTDGDIVAVWPVAGRCWACSWPVLRGFTLLARGLAKTRRRGLGRAKLPLWPNFTRPSLLSATTPCDEEIHCHSQAAPQRRLHNSIRSSCFAHSAN